MIESFPNNNTEKKKVSSYEEVLNEIEQTFNDEEKVKAFISKRIKEIENKDDKGEIGIMSRSWHDGFISHESPIRRSYMVEPFYMDDDSIYESLFSVIRKTKETPGWKERPLRSIMPYIIQQTIYEYFGNLAGFTDTEQNNRSFYLEHDSVENSRISISDFRNKNMAVCIEKSAFAENIASFVGLESYLVLSSNCKIKPEEEGTHAYNIWRSSSGYYIYDPANPILSIDREANKILQYAPAIYKIDEETFNNMRNGGSTTVTHTNQVFNTEKNTTTPEVVERTYSGAKK